MSLKYKDIEYDLSRSQRKTASIYIERDGRVSVMAPDQWSDEQVQHVLER
ncbi:MAG: M48 family peptidase, partial [Flavobacteriales bacterium]|nr:M48 family peptidase [Flavobacteriales bacterium]